MSRIESYKNPDVFKKSFEEFKKDDLVRIKFEKGNKIYRIAGVYPDDTLAILEGRAKPVDFSQLELAPDELSDKLFEGAMQTASQAAKVDKVEKEPVKTEEELVEV